MVGKFVLQGRLTRKKKPSKADAFQPPCPGPRWRDVLHAGLLQKCWAIFYNQPIRYTSPANDRYLLLAIMIALADEVTMLLVILSPCLHAILHFCSFGSNGRHKATTTTKNRRENISSKATFLGTFRCKGDKKQTEIQISHTHTDMLNRQI